MQCDDATESLDKETNTCVGKQPEDEEKQNEADTLSCFVVGQFFDSVAGQCTPFVDCDALAGLELDAATNTCLQAEASLSSCTIQSKYFNTATITCEEWVICNSDAGEQLDPETNTCEKLVPGEESETGEGVAETTLTCFMKGQYFNPSTELCEEWEVCEQGAEDLDSNLNKCVEKAASEETCAVKDLYYNAEAGTCDSWLTCDAEAFVTLDKSTNACVEAAASQASCQYRDKYFNEAASECVEWAVCSLALN